MYQYFDILEKHYPGSNVWEMDCTDSNMSASALNNYITHLRTLGYTMTVRYDRVANVHYYYDIDNDNVPLFAVRKLH